MMKQRLCGLLALVLCMMVAGMPVAALAAQKYHLEYSSFDVDVETGDLISVGQNLYFTIDGSDSYESAYATAYYYYEGYAEKPSSTSSEWNKDEKASLKNKHQDADSMPKASLWHVIQYDDTDEVDLLRVEPVGAEVTINSQTTGIFVSKTILSQWTGSKIFSPSEIVSAFENVASGRDMEVYEVMNLWQINGGYAYRPLESGATFRLPKPENATNIQVLHFTDGTVEPIAPANVADKGHYLEITTDHFSPFAIVYDVAVNAGNAASQPKTGDPAQLALWFTLAGLSLAGMAYTALRRRKRA